MTIKQRQTVTIGLMWHSMSSDNLGVGALTESNIGILDECARRVGVTAEYIVFGTSGSHPLVLSHNRVRQGGHLSLKKALMRRTTFIDDVRACDFVFDIGEGDSFTDIYGARRYLRLLLTKVVVLMLGRQLILSPQTIGPFGNIWTRLLATRVMQRSARVFARDKLSYEYLHSLGVIKNAACATDVAFRLTYQKPETSAGSLRVGLNVSGLLFSGGYTGDNQFHLSVDYRELVTRLVRHWLRQPNCEVWLVPHVLATEIAQEDDRRANAEVAASHPSCRIAPDFRTPSEAKAFISSLDFFTGARMHACIAALSAGVPVVPFAYSRKFEGLFSTVAYPMLIDGRKETTDAAFEKIVDASTNLPKYRATAAASVQIAQALLAEYEKYVVEVFRDRQP
jgi:polysaccharide pyruvyl transferase WcaK-like protein